MSDARFAVFTKPWKMPLPELGAWIHKLGFDGIELPVRPGYQVDPDHVGELAHAARVLADHGVTIASIAGPTDERTLAACAEAGIKIIRICETLGPDGYMATEARRQREYAAMVPLLDKYDVTLGIQNHCGNFCTGAMNLRHLIERFDPRHIGAVLDAGHIGLQGEEPEAAIDIVWSHLCMVNLKSAYWRRTNGPEALEAAWGHHWTTGRHGLATWSRYVTELKRRGYRGWVCLTAEYSDHDAVDRLIVEDIAFAKELFA